MRNEVRIYWVAILLLTKHKALLFLSNLRLVPFHLGLLRLLGRNEPNEVLCNFICGIETGAQIENDTLSILGNCPRVRQTANNILKIIASVEKFADLMNEMVNGNIIESIFIICLERLTSDVTQSRRTEFCHGSLAGGKILLIAGDCNEFFVQRLHRFVCNDFGLPGECH